MPPHVLGDDRAQGVVVDGALMASFLAVHHALRDARQAAGKAGEVPVLPQPVDAQPFPASRAVDDGEGVVRPPFRLVPRLQRFPPFLHALHHAGVYHLRVRAAVDVFVELAPVGLDLPAQVGGGEGLLEDDHAVVLLARKYPVDHVVVDVLPVDLDAGKAEQVCDGAHREAGEVEGEDHLHDRRLVGYHVDVPFRVLCVADYPPEEGLPPSGLHVLSLAGRDPSADEPRFLLRHGRVDAQDELRVRAGAEDVVELEVDLHAEVPQLVDGGEDVDEVPAEPAYLLAEDEVDLPFAAVPEHFLVAGPLGGHEPGLRLVGVYLDELPLSLVFLLDDPFVFFDLRLVAVELLLGIGRHPCVGGDAQVGGLVLQEVTAPFPGRPYYPWPEQALYPHRLSPPGPSPSSAPLSRRRRRRRR